MIQSFLSPQRSVRTDIFDLLPSIAAEAGYAIHKLTGGVDEGLIRAQLIAAMAAAVAPLYRLSLPGWHPIPLEVPVICIGRSGVSKTPVYRYISEAFLAFDSERQHDYKIEQEAYEAGEALRKIKQDELKGEIKRKKKHGEDWQYEQLELERTLIPIPRPKLRTRLCTALDFEKLVHLVGGDNEAVNLFFNEGDQPLNNVLFKRHAGVFNDLHDGTATLETPQQRRRVARAINPNVARLFLLRESSLEKFRPTERNGTLEKSALVDMGYFARFLVYFADELPRDSGLWAPTDPDAAIAAFNRRILDMLKAHHAKLVDGDTDRRLLQLAPEAIPFWREKDREIRTVRSHCTSRIDEHLGKLLSLAARLAAIFHVLESDSDLVSLHALQRAWQVVDFHVPHYARAFSPPPEPLPLKQVEQDVYALADLFRARTWQVPGNNRVIDVNECVMRLNIPKRRVLHAASKLEDRGQVSVSSNREQIDFRNIMRPTSCIRSRF